MFRLNIQGGDPDRVSPQDAGGRGERPGKAGQGDATRAQVAGSIRVAPQPIRSAGAADGIAAGAIAEISAAGRQAAIQAATTKPGPGPMVARVNKPIADVARDAKREIRYLFEQGLVFSDNVVARQREIAERVSQEAAPIIAAANRAAALQASTARQSVEVAAHALRDIQAA